MAVTPTSLGAGSRVGTWGVYQDKDILSVDPLLIPPKGVVIQFYSPSDTLVYTAFSGKGQSKNIQVTWAENKIGGLISFSITLPRDNAIALYSGLKAKVNIDGNYYFNGEIKDIPATDTSDDEIVLKGTGFFNRLAKVELTETYSSLTIKNIIMSLSDELFSAGVGLDSAKIDDIPITIGTIVLENKTVQDLLSMLKDICNYDYNTEQCIYGVDEYNDLYFKLISASDSVEASYFEGKHYQYPEVVLDTSNLTNRVDLFRTDEASGKDTSFVGSYEDLGSIDSYGLQYRKVVLSDYVSNDQAEQYATAIIEKNNVPIKQISVQSLVINNKLDFGFYNITNKRTSQNYVIDEFSDLTDWTKNITQSLLTLSTANVFSGGSCFKWDFTEGELDSIERSFEKIYSPKTVQLRVNKTFESDELLEVIVSGKASKGIEEVTLNWGDTEEDTITWLWTNPIILTDDFKDKRVFHINASYLSTWETINLDISDLFYIDSIRIACKGENICLLDRLEVQSFSYNGNKIALEEIEYKLDRTSLLAEATFGQSKTTLISELKKLNETTLASYNIFGKS